MRLISVTVFCAALAGAAVLVQVSGYAERSPAQADKNAQPDSQQSDELAGLRKELKELRDMIQTLENKVAPEIPAETKRLLDEVLR